MSGNKITVIVLTFVAVGVALAGGISALLWRALELDAECKAYVDSVVPAIAESWSVDTVMREASRELEQSAPRQSVARLFQSCSERLGKLTAYDGAVGEVNVSITTQQGKVVTGRYTAAAQFEKDEATFEVRTVKRNGQWRILYFGVTSDALLP